MPPFVALPPPPVSIEVIAPRETDNRVAPAIADSVSAPDAPRRSVIPTAPVALAVVPPPVLAPFPTLETSPEAVPVSPEAQGLNHGQNLQNSPALQQELPLGNAKRLITQTRTGATQEFIITAPAESSPKEAEAPAVEPPPPSPPPEVVELISDRQEYDSDRQMVIATGNVTMRFANGVLLADRLQVNLPDRFAVAEGNVTLQRGQQILQGERFEYFFVLDKGVIYNAQGEIYQPSTARDLNPTLPTDPNRPSLPGIPLNERLGINQPLQNVVGQEGLVTGIGASAPGATSASQATTGGQVNRLRFQAERVNFDAQGWQAQKVRITNDPFSPPELEVQAETADYYNVAPQVDEVRLTGSRVLLDQRTSLPFQDRLTIDRRDRQPSIWSIGYDGEDRGGLYIQAGFTPIDTETVRFQVKPQYLLQKVIDPQGYPEANQSDASVCALCPAAFGLITELDATFGDRTQLRQTLNFSNLNLDSLDNSLRAKVSLQNKVGPLDNPHDLRIEYNYRERLYNGSLGFQTVNSSFGAILVSPIITLGDPSLQLSYQASIQNVQADTDRQDLINPSSGDSLVTLMRYQGAAAVNKFFLLWSGQGLPPTPDKGLKYTPNPVVPYLGFNTGMTGVASYYSDGSSQPSLTGSIGFMGQLGHFSRPYLDYTGFNIGYSQGLRGGISPFFFDRFADTQVLTYGLTQQIYGPFRLGVQGAYSITANEGISNDFLLEYSRRTYNIQLRYNPDLQVGSINLRISDFNWNGNPGTFGGTDIRPVVQGVIR